MLSIQSKEPVYIEKNGHVATIVINRPHRKNAIDFDTAILLSEKFQQFEEDDTVRVGVLYGVGGFCSGADLKEIQNGRGNRLEDEGDAPLGPSRMQLSKPMIAAVSGFAVAGGMELALLCDLRVVEESAVFGVFCRRWGIPLIDGGTVRLPRLIGLSRAMDLILTGRPVDSKEAYSIGLANRLVADGTARVAAEELAQQLAALPQECMLADRLSAHNQFSYSVEDALRREFSGAKHIAQSMIAEGVAKFNNRVDMKK